MNSLKAQYKKEVVPALQERFGYKNQLAVPNIKGIILNVGIGLGLKDKEYIDTVKSTLSRISGQKPIETLSKKSISNFKIRQGMAVGIKVTLRGARMWDFLEKLIKITFPRVRDFRGLNAASFDQKGNYSLGLKECIAFPEIRQDELERVHGLQITISTTTRNIEEGRALLTELGFPFKLDETK